jgi:type II secretory pathway component GspD/PulD (secretin)
MKNECKLIVPFLLLATSMFVAAPTSFAQSPEVAAEYAQLADESTAAALSLTDEQNAAVATIMAQHNEAVAAAEDGAKAGLRAAAEQKLSALLTAEQQAAFATLFSQPKLKFNFRLQKWDAVLDWVADEAGLSLVMDEAPPGTFNYSDSKEYTPTEAIDLLNGWLLTKGYTLVRRERLVMCLNLKGGLPEGAIPRVTLEDLGTRGRFEFVSVLIPLEGRPADETLTEITPLLGTYGKADMLAATQQLLVADAAATVRIIQQVVNKIPLPKTAATPKPAAPAPKPELMIYPIEHANPEQAGEVLKQIVDGTIVIDATASQISINAIPTEQEKAKTIIGQLESNQGPDKQPQLKLYAARVRDTAELLATMKLVSPDGEFRYDEASRKLVAWANATDQIRISGALKELETQQPAGGTTQLEVYQLSEIDPAAAQTLVTSLMPEVKVTVDSRTGSLIAIGTLSDHQAILTLLEQLEPQVANRKPAELKSYPVDLSISAAATSVLGSVVPEATITTDAANERLLVVAPPEKHELVASTLLQLAENLAKPDQQLKTYDTRGVDTASVISLLSTLNPTAQITDDVANKRLLVIASAEDHASVENVLQQVVSDEHTMDTLLKSYPMAANVVPETVTSLLTTLTPTASVTVDSPNRRLLITATTKDHDVIEATIAQVARDATGELPELQFYPLVRASGENAASVLQAMLPAAQITYEAVSNRLSAVAAKADHIVLRTTLDKLEEAAPADEKRTLKVYDVTTAQRQRFTAILDSLSSELPGLQVLTDAQPREMTVWAKPSQQDIVTEVLAQLQRDVPPEQKPKLIVYPIRKVDPNSVSTVLAELFPDAKITVDTVAGRLLINARPQLHETIKSAIEQLDSDVDGDTEIKLMVYPVKGIDPANAMQLLTSEVPRATVIHDTTGQTLIVRARLSQQQQVAELLDALRSASTPLRERTVVVYPMSHSNTTAEQTFFQNAFPDSTVVLDPTAQTMTALATTNDHVAIRSAVEAMSEAASEGGAEVKTYSVVGMDVTGVAGMLTAAVPDAKIVFADNKLLAWGQPEDHSIIQSIVEGTQAAPVDRSITAFDVREIGMATGQSVLAEVAPEIAFLQGGDGTSLIAWVDEATKMRIEETLQQLSGSPAANTDRTLRFYDIETAGGSNAQTVLGTAVPTVTFTATTDGKRLLALVSSDEHQKIETTLTQLTAEKPFAAETTLQLYSIRDLGPSAVTVLSQSVPAASITTGARPDQIAVVASLVDHDRLSKVLAQLVAAKSPLKKKTLAIFDIHGTDPAAVQTVLQPLVGADVQLTVDPTGRRLYVRAFADKQDLIKATIDQITSNLQPDGELETKTYLVGAPNADEAQEVLLALYPDATIVTDRDRKLIVATATAEQHVRIGEIAEQIAGVDMDENASYPVVYRTNNVSAAYTEDLLDNLFTRLDNVRFAVNDRTGRLVAVARTDQHKVIDDLISQFDGDPTEQIKRDLAVYRVLPLDGLTVKEALEPLVSKDVTISAGRRSDQILVSAPPEEQQQIATLIQQITMARVGGTGVETKTYQMTRGEADEAQEVLQALFPNATLVTDAGREVLVATASAEEHKTIDQVVQQMTGKVRTANSPAPKTYRLNQADGYVVLEVLEALFLRADEVRLSLDDVSQTVVAVARPDQHETIAALLAELDPPDGASMRKLQMYSVHNMDGDIISEVVDSVLQEEDRGAKVFFESATESLLVTTTMAGHAAAKDTIARFGTPEPRQIEVFQLAFLEPRVAQTAIDQMISSRFFHEATRPQVHADEDMQQLWVQASASQISDMRSLMVKMGEVGLNVGANSSNRNLRVIPVGDDVGGAIKRIQDLWPKLRKNPIKVLHPGQKNVPGQFSVPPEDTSQGQGDVPDSEAGEQTAGPAVQEADSQLSTPVVIMPGNGRLTIASDDAEALDQMESLLRAIYSRPTGGRNRDFSIYQLTNAGASDVATTLQQIFDDTEGLISFGHVAMVPDERLNSLIVYASRADRSRIEQLLEVLDSDKFEDTKRAYVTRVIPVQYTDAGRVEDVLKGVYRPQLTAGGARSTISIPKGVPSGVATVLRQINAAAAAPLLTIEVQTDTNSLVVKAPQDLLDEVSELVASLDEVSQTSRARGLTLLPLKKTKASRVMEILGDVLD